MVFQNYALYPYLDVASNIAFPLKMARVPKAERERRVRQAAEVLELTDYLERKPAQLSGGQRQRVAMGRAIVREPKAFLMDEPLSNLDAKLRVQMRGEIASLQARLGITSVYVTHDQVEAMTMGASGGSAARGPPDAVRDTAGALRQAAEHFRRRVHRIARDEPVHRAPRGRKRRSSTRSGFRSTRRPRRAPMGWARSSSASGRSRSSRPPRGSPHGSIWSRSSAPTPTRSASPSWRGARRSSRSASIHGGRPGAGIGCR